MGHCDAPKWMIACPETNWKEKERGERDGGEEKKEDREWSGIGVVCKEGD